MSKGTSFPSQRADLADEGLLNPVYALRAQDIFPDSEQLNKMTAVRKIAADVFGGVALSAKLHFSILPE